MQEQSHVNQRALNLILIFGFLLALFSSSIKNSFQILFVNISGDLMETRGNLAIAASTFMLVQGLSAPIVGHASDRFSAKKVILIGVLMTGISFILISRTGSLLTFIFLYGIIASIGFTSISFIPIGVLVDKVFPSNKRGLIFAMITNGMGVGFILLPPVWIYIQNFLGWRTIFLLIGVTFILPLPLLLNFTLPSIEIEGNVKHVREHGTYETTIRHLREIIGNRFFYILAGSFFSCGISMAFIDIHLVPFMQDGSVDSINIAIVLIVLGSLQLIGGYIFGFLSDRSLKINLILSMLYLVRGLSIWILLYHPINSTVLLIFSTIFGLTYTGTVVITSIFCLELFGINLKGFAFGLVFLIHQVGALLSSFLGATFFDVFSNYNLAILLSGCFTIFSGIVSLLLPSKRINPLDSHQIVQD